MELSNVMQLARGLSPNKTYLPERSPDFPFFKAIVQTLREEAGTDGGNGIPADISSGVLYTFDRTVSGLSTGTYEDLFTVSSTNSAAGLFLFSSYIEGEGTSGLSVSSYLTWSFNAASPVNTLSWVAAGGAGSESTFDGPTMLAANINTVVQWKYDVTVWPAGTSDIRLLFYLQQIA